MREHGHQTVVAERPATVTRAKRTACLLGWLWHPPPHLLTTDGAFSAECSFRALPQWDATLLMSLFRERLLEKLLKKRAISQELVGKLLAWRHPGFSAHVGEPIVPEHRLRLETVAAYLVKSPLSLKKLVHLDGPLVDGGPDWCTISVVPLHWSRSPAVATDTTIPGRAALLSERRTSLVTASAPAGPACSEAPAYAEGAAAAGAGSSTPRAGGRRERAVPRSATRPTKLLLLLAGGTEATPTSREGDEHAPATLTTPQPGEGVFRKPAPEEAPQHAPDDRTQGTVGFGEAPGPHAQQLLDVYLAMGSKARGAASGQRRGDSRRQRARGLMPAGRPPPPCGT